MSLHDKLGTLNYLSDDRGTDPMTRRLQGYTAHGSHVFDVPYITQIVDNLYQGGCTSGLVLPENIKHIISLYPWERYSIFHDVDTEAYFYFYDDLSNFSTAQVDMVEAVSDLAVAACHSSPVLIHCQAGLNRSSLIMGRAIMKAYGWKADKVIDLIREKRSPACLCNSTFEKYLQDWNDL